MMKIEPALVPSGLGVGRYQETSFNFSQLSNTSFNVDCPHFLCSSLFSSISALFSSSTDRLSICFSNLAHGKFFATNCS